MEAVKKIENQLAPMFKNAPALPDTSKESLVKAWPWIALIFGILQLIAAWGLWGLLSFVERTYYGAYADFYKDVPGRLSGVDRTFIYIGVAVLVVDAVILLLAYPELKKRSRRGWDLLFLGALLNTAYAVVNLFINDRGLGGFLFSLVGSAIGFYLLFQVREKYGKAAGNKHS